MNERKNEENTHAFIHSFIHSFIESSTLTEEDLCHVVRSSYTVPGTCDDEVLLLKKKMMTTIPTW